MAAINVYEILEEFEKQKTTEEKKNVLRKYDSYALRMTLRAAMHPRIKFVMEEIPPYKQSYAPPGLGYGTLHQVFDKIYLFEEGNPKVPAGLTMERRKQILVQLMENLESREAKVFESVLMKNLKVKGLTPKLVTEVFPDLLT
jgi:hypothetical protein